MNESASTSGLMIRVRWKGNSSKRYNGRVQDIAAKHVLPEDTTPQVGATIRNKWGQRIQYAAVVGLQAEEGSVTPPVSNRPRLDQGNLQAEEDSVAPPVSKRPKLDQGNLQAEEGQEAPEGKAEVAQTQTLCGSPYF